MTSKNAALLEILAIQSSPMEPLPTTLKPRLPKLDGIRAVIFDIYGTLFISGSGDISLAQERNRESALRTAAADSLIDLSNISLDISESLLAAIKTSHARDHDRGIEYPEVEIRELWTELLREFDESKTTPEDIEALAVRFETRVNPVWPMPGTDVLLSTLRRQGMRLGIISNAQFYTPLLFEHFLGNTTAELGIEDEDCFWSYRERRAKPSQKLFEQCCAALERKAIAPNQAVYVGNDMRNDIVPAAEVGMRTALFAGDDRSLRLRQFSADDIPADLILTELGQLPDCLGGP